jgi:ubiquinone/menaquinone biosynthesis C-methylase UbiE/ribosomal protein S18 acetylase RimI-like enzyme
MASDPSARPLFARCLARSAAISERKGAAEYRRRLLAGLTGEVIEVGAGTGITFGHYPSTVSRVVAVEPEPNLRAEAEVAARGSSAPISVVTGTAEDLPAPDASMDAAVCAGVLCSVPNQAAALAELARVLRPGGQLRFFEHVRSRRPRAATLQRALDASGVWARAMGGCRTSRDTECEIERAGFRVESIERFNFRPTLLDLAVAPKILGRARLSQVVGATPMLRQAGVADVPRLAELVRGAYGHYVERLGEPPRPMTDDYAEVVRRFRVTVAEHRGQIVGLIASGVDDEGFVVDNVAVDPSHQGRGVGRLLLEHAELDARRAGFDSIYLYTHELMVENLAYYSRLGYVEYDRRLQGKARVVYLRKQLG